MAEGRADGVSVWQEGGEGSLVVLLLAERAPSEGPRSTRAVGD
jgi:hypothetical protein